MLKLSRLPTGEPEIFTSIQGEGVTAGLPSTFVRLSLCSLHCDWCFVPETPVLMADWSWRRLGSLQVGDEVIGLGHHERHGSHPRLVRATVTHTSFREAATVTVNGTVRCTPDHKFWLTGRDALGTHNVHSGWRNVERAIGKRVLFVAAPQPLDEDLYQRGWLAGMADGDGCFWSLKHRRDYRRFRLALKEASLLKQAQVFAGRQHFVLRDGRHFHTGFGGPGVMECLWLTHDTEARRFEQWVSADVDDDAWRFGHVGGMLDAEGSLSRGILRLAQFVEPNGATLARARRALDALGLRYTVEAQGLYPHRAHGALWRIITCARPAKASIRAAALGHHPHVSRVISSVEPTGDIESVVTLTTTCGSFVAGGYVVKNCDTPYTWDWSRYDPKAEIVRLAVPEVARRVAAGGTRNVVITGGEPLLQQAEVATLAEALKEAGKRLEVETSGTVLPEPALAAQIDQWNVSPKLASSGNEEARRLVPAALGWFAAQGNAYFKFVVTAPADLEEVQALVGRFGVPAERVLLMPEGTTAATLAERSGWVVERCQALGYRFTTRLHILLWGDKRGR
jgi:7-carboxy-7-deazaguanine synthase